MPPDLNDLAMAIGYIVMGSSGIATSAVLAWGAFELVARRIGFTRNLYRRLRELAEYERNRRGA